MSMRPAPIGPSLPQSIMAARPVWSQPSRLWPIATCIPWPRPRRAISLVRNRAALRKRIPTPLNPRMAMSRLARSLPGRKPHPTLRRTPSRRPTRHGLRRGLRPARQLRKSPRRTRSRRPGGQSLKKSPRLGRQLRNGLLRKSPRLGSQLRKSLRRMSKPSRHSRNMRRRSPAKIPERQHKGCAITQPAEPGWLPGCAPGGPDASRPWQPIAEVRSPQWACRPACRRQSPWRRVRRG